MNMLRSIKDSLTEWLGWKKLAAPTLVNTPFRRPPKLRKETLPLPPEVMRQRVRKGARKKSTFIREGQQVFRSVGDLVSRNGISFDSIRILEFGVGCGRIARHFFHSGHTSFVGVDVDGQMIDWCNANLASRDERFAFFTNNYLPPLNLEEKSIDFAFSISVFTHLSGEDQKVWFDEICRVICPGGFFIATFIEEDPNALLSGVSTNLREDPTIPREWLGRDGAPDQYLTTRSSLQWFTSLADECFDTIDVDSLAIRGKQSFVLFRKR